MTSVTSSSSHGVGLPEEIKRMIQAEDKFCVVCRDVESMRSDPRERWLLEHPVFAYCMGHEHSAEITRMIELQLVSPTTGDREQREVFQRSDNVIVLCAIHHEQFNDERDPTPLILPSDLDVLIRTERKVQMSMREAVSEGRATSWPTVLESLEASGGAPASKAATTFYLQDANYDIIRFDITFPRRLNPPFLLHKFVESFLKTSPPSYAAGGTHWKPSRYTELLGLYWKVIELQTLYAGRGEIYIPRDTEREAQRVRELSPSRFMDTGTGRQSRSGAEGRGTSAGGGQGTGRTAGSGQGRQGEGPSDAEERQEAGPEGVDEKQPIGPDDAGQGEAMERRVSSQGTSVGDGEQLVEGWAKTVVPGLAPPRDEAGVGMDSFASEWSRNSKCELL